jgi:hypothetical protein
LALERESNMAIFTTAGEQVRVRRMAEKVGGYSELLRLDAEKKALGPHAEPKLIMDRSGRFTYIDMKAPEAKAG